MNTFQEEASENANAAEPHAKTQPDQDHHQPWQGPTTFHPFNTHPLNLKVLIPKLEKLKLMRDSEVTMEESSAVSCRGKPWNPQLSTDQPEEEATAKSKAVEQEQPASEQGKASQEDSLADEREARQELQKMLQEAKAAEAAAKARAEEVERQLSEEREQTRQQLLVKLMQERQARQELQTALDAARSSQDATITPTIYGSPRVTDCFGKEKEATEAHLESVHIESSDSLPGPTESCQTKP